jgi:hypothetical protein
LLLGVWLGYHWLYPRELPVLDVEGLGFANLIRMSATRERVEEYFRDQYQMTISTPDRFNYTFLEHYGLADEREFQGKRVPRLIFFAQGDDGARAYACVYIISGKQFDLNALLSTPPSNSGGQSIVVWPDELNPGIAYLIIHTGDSLQRFLVNDQRRRGVGVRLPVSSPALGVG